ncbi:hypothetical protein [Methanocalculus natronophilus]|uniref:hypothetical protein n=1 Tax=Methanocalculus natronophilus TaxID=1262400 RepID=UPI0031B624C6
MSEAVSTAEARIEELENRLRFPGHTAEQLKIVLANEARDRLQAERRIEDNERARLGAIEKVKRTQNEIISWVKSGRLRIEVEGKRIASIKEPAIPCSRCKKPIPETISLLLSLHERLSYCGNDGILMMRAGALFWDSGYACQHCGDHNRVKIQIVLIE